MTPAEIIKPPLFGTAADACRMFFDYKNEQVVNNRFPVDVVFIGDSITHMWELDYYFGYLGHILNRGISGDVAEIMIKRFEADVIQLKPRVCVMMIGINNIFPEEAVHDDVMEKLFSCYQEALSRLKEEGILPVVCSVIPVYSDTEAHTARRNEWVLEANRGLVALCEAEGAAYVNYHEKLTEEDGCTLRRGCSWDGIHPHSVGYACMAEALTPILVELLG